MRAGLVSGFFVVVLTYISLKYTKLGLLGVILAQGLVQLTYNYWKWPLYVLRQMNINFFNLVEIGAKQCIVKVRNIINV